MATERFPSKAIIEDYTSGVSISEIKQKYGIVYDSTIYQMLKRYGIQADRRGVNRENPTKYDQDQVLKDYLSGMSLRDIASKHGFPHYQVIYPILKRGGVVRERTGGLSPLSRKPWNSEFFSHQNEVSAYWAGFLMADGSLGNDKGNTWSLKLSVHERDLVHLLSYCDAIELDRNFVRSQPTRFKTKEYMMCDATVYHPTLPETLQQWGIVQRKTYEYAEPKVQSDMLPHFLRGWFDGDGHLIWSKKTKRLGVTGNQNALHWYASALRSLGLEGNISLSHADGKVWGRLNIFGADNINRVADLLKAHTSFRLARKWDKLHGG